MVSMWLVCLARAFCGTSQGLYQGLTFQDVCIIQTEKKNISIKILTPVFSYMLRVLITNTPIFIPETIKISMGDSLFFFLAFHQKVQGCFSDSVGALPAINRWCRHCTFYQLELIRITTFPLSFLTGLLQDLAAWDEKIKAFFSDCDKVVCVVEKICG